MRRDSGLSVVHQSVTAAENEAKLLWGWMQDMWGPSLCASIRWGGCLSKSRPHWSGAMRFDMASRMGMGVASLKVT